MTNYEFRSIIKTVKGDTQGQAKADGSSESESKNARSEWERIRESEIANGIDV